MKKNFAYVLTDNIINRASQRYPVFALVTVTYTTTLYICIIMLQFLVISIN